MTGDDVFRPISTFSGGEKGRLALCKLMLRRDNLLLLDEPTNHLDMDSREVLEKALENFDGTLLTVSHDRYFINRVANKVIELNTDGAIEYLGNYDDYLEKKRRESEPEEQTMVGMTRTEQDKIKRRERLAKESKQSLLKKVKTLEADIARKEEEIALLEEKMADPEIYKTDGGEAIMRAHTQAKEDLEALYELWTEAADAAEQS